MKRLLILASLAVAVLAVGGGSYLSFESLVSATASHEEQSRRLVPFALEQVSAIDFVRENTAHRFVRDAEGNWFHHDHAQSGDHHSDHTHVVDLEDSDRIAEILGRFVATEIETAGGDGPTESGPDDLRMFVFLYQPDTLEPVWRLQIGDTTPDGTRRYVKIADASSAALIPEARVQDLVNLTNTVGGAPAEAGE